MIGGLLKSTSRTAVIATAGVLSTTVIAQAADLGGNCCADLEERVAELEATTARKGNRKVSLTVSGHVHEAVVFFDVDTPVTDLPAASNESNAYIGTHNSSRTRFRFRGDAAITADWSAGFFIEIGVRRNDLSATSQSVSRSPVANAAAFNGRLDIRHEALYIRSKTYGTIWLGHTSSAVDGITEICIGCALSNTAPGIFGDVLGLFASNGLAFRSHAARAAAFPGEGDRRSIAKWISPTFAGFSLSAGVGGDDFWDIALRYAAELGQFRVAAGVGYSVDTGGAAESGAAFQTRCSAVAINATRCVGFATSATIQHVPTGLYFAGTYGMNREDNAAFTPGGLDTDNAWRITGGLQTKLNSLGKTNFWGMYAHAEREIDLTATTLTELTWYGVGVDQQIDAAAMQVYLWWKRFEAEQSGISTGDADVVTLGARIKF